MENQEANVKCYICGREDAHIREIELPTARITLRAHVDCEGHNQYRRVSRVDVARAQQNALKRVKEE